MVQTLRILYSTRVHTAIAFGRLLRPDSEEARENRVERRAEGPRNRPFQHPLWTRQESSETDGRGQRRQPTGPVVERTAGGFRQEAIPREASEATSG